MSDMEADLKSVDIIYEHYINIFNTIKNPGIVVAQPRIRPHEMQKGKLLRPEPVFNTNTFNLSIRTHEVY